MEIHDMFIILPNQRENIFKLCFTIIQLHCVYMGAFKVLYYHEA